jgi:Protein of unknown function (DUF2380)
MPRLSLLSAVVAVVLAATYPVQAETRKCVAAFDFELIDLSLEGQFNGDGGAEQKRLALISERLRGWLAAEGYRVCDLAPVAAEAKAANLYGCGCVQKLAARVDAGFAITGIVQKVSNLILNVEIGVIDAGTNKLLVQANAQFRSNTDESWTRGLDWLIKHRLTAALASLQGAKP